MYRPRTICRCSCLRHSSRSRWPVDHGDDAVTEPDHLRRTLLFHSLRLQFPRLPLARDRFDAHLDRTFALFQSKSEAPVTWTSYLDGLYSLDWAVTVGCLEGIEAAWELLFAARMGRSDSLLVDALRARAVRLYPRNEERQETAVAEFWSGLIVSESEHVLPVLARYDGQRPLAPWLVRVFQNSHLSKLRKGAGAIALPDDDLAVPLPTMPREELRWHELFVAAARDWLDAVPDGERLILGLRWRYKMSQRDVANLLGVHEGTISRQTDKLRDKALEAIGERLVRDGWAGEDLEGFVLTELGGVLTDDPRLSADELSRLLGSKGKALAG
ncbi:MAG: sigma-70 family RNA polymerase sigma factor [Planctomycetia bacterium]|nr:sigma-70 family RNA polymerase sigma factor [Planctomycetia bacterium]